MKIRVCLKYFVNDCLWKQLLASIIRNMADNTDMLRDEERITKLIKKVFEDELKKQEQNLVKIISGNLEITMQEIKSFKNEVNDLKKSMEFTQSYLEERVNNVEENICKVEEDLKEIYEYQIDPGYVNDCMTDIKNKLAELEDRSRRNNVQLDGIAEEPEETWEECEGKVQGLLSEKPDVNDVVKESAHRVKAYSPKKKNSKKLRLRTVVCKLLSFVDKARILKNSHRLEGTSYYVNEDLSKETLAYRKELWEKVKVLRKESKIAYLNYKSIVVRKRNDPQV